MATQRIFDLLFADQPDEEPDGWHAQVANEYDALPADDAEHVRWVREEQEAAWLNARLEELVDWRDDEEFFRWGGA